MLSLRDIVKVYESGDTRVTALNGVSIDFRASEFVSILGPSGCGKTTLLRIIIGLLQPTDGQILLDGKDITHLPEHRRYEQIGRVYQNPAMGSCHDLTILENLCLAENKNKPFGFGRAVDRKRAAHFAEMLRPLGLGLEEKPDVLVGALSGGQRQALSLLMATMTPIRFLILDEHTAALDPKTAEIIMELTDRIVREKKLTAIMVTHNLRYAVEYGSRMLMMHKGSVILDKTGEEKAAVTVADLLATFNDISIECGN